MGPKTEKDLRPKVSRQKRGTESREVSREQSDPFSISNGVKQGCVLAPVLFNLFFACVLRQAVGNTDK